MDTTEPKLGHGEIGVNTEFQRTVPADISDASIRSQRGELIDITSLIPVNLNDADDAFQKDVQGTFDNITKIVSSPEYFQFRQEIQTMLEKVNNNDFLIDLEGTLMDYVEDLFNFPVDTSKIVYYINPWIQAIIQTLIKNDNQIGFWTSATVEYSGKMRKAMSPEISSLTTIAREDYEKVVRAFRTKHLNQSTDQQVLGIMQSVFPRADMENFHAGIKVLTEERLKTFDNNPMSFLRHSKFPQLFISPKNGFFIDDNDLFISSAINSGWPTERAIKCNYSPSKENAIEVAKTISLPQ
jgi:uncharacterized protein YkvS